MKKKQFHLIKEFKIFPDTNSLIEWAKKNASRCLSKEERKIYFLNEGIPEWCTTKKDGEFNDTFQSKIKVAH
jgi:hypothetical protein